MVQTSLCRMHATARSRSYNSGEAFYCSEGEARKLVAQGEAVYAQAPAPVIPKVVKPAPKAPEPVVMRPEPQPIDIKPRRITKPAKAPITKDV